jgi:hypothetical protein
MTWYEGDEISKKILRECYIGAIHHRQWRVLSASSPHCPGVRTIRVPAPHGLLYENRGYTIWVGLFGIQRWLERHDGKFSVGPGGEK